MYQQELQICHLSLTDINFPVDNLVGQKGVSPLKTVAAAEVQSAAASGFMIYGFVSIC